MIPTLRLIVFALIASSAFADTGSTFAGTSDSKVEKAPFVPTKWKLIWADEFNRTGAPDTASWKPEVGYVRNGEKQFYTSGRSENARLEGGNLVLEARRDNWKGNAYTSASITTEGKHEFLYGRIVVRAKLPTGRGTWPAIWMLGTDFKSLGWPGCGEIDIMENVGFDPAKVHGNIHTTAYNHIMHTNKGSTIDLGQPWTQFHDYAIEWYPDRLEFFVDDTRYFIFRKDASPTNAKWPFSKPQYLILNLAIGGGWGGQKGIDNGIFPQRMLVDYVRYYQHL